MTTANVVLDTASSSSSIASPQAAFSPVAKAVLSKMAVVSDEVCHDMVVQNESSSGPMQDVSKCSRPTMLTLSGIPYISITFVQFSSVEHLGKSCHRLSGNWRVRNEPTSLKFRHEIKIEGLVA